MQRMAFLLLTVSLLTTPKRNTPGFDNPRSVSACVPEAFCTINLTFVFFFT